MKQSRFTLSEQSESKGLAPILIVILVTVLGIGGYFVYTNYSNNRTKVDISDLSDTKGWQTLDDSTKNNQYKEIPVINFSFEYPNNLQVTDLPGTMSKQATNNTAVSNQWKPGTFSVFGSLLNLQNNNGNDPIETRKNTMLDGREAVRSLQSDRNALNLIKRLEYKVTSLNLQAIDSKWGFSLNCYFVPKEGEDLEGLCDKIASTFKFTQ